MLPGPVFFHEVRAVARRKRAYALRVLIGLFLLYVVVTPWYRGNSLVYSSAGNVGFSPHEMAMIARAQAHATLALAAATALGGITLSLPPGSSLVADWNAAIGVKDPEAKP